MSNYFSDAWYSQGCLTDYDFSMEYTSMTHIANQIIAENRFKAKVMQLARNINRKGDKNETR